MQNVIGKIKRYFSGIALSVVIVFSFVTLTGIGIGMNQSMDSMSDGQCIFDYGSGCTMNLNEHLSLWDDFFMANLTNSETEVQFLLVMMPFIVLAFAFRREIFGLRGSPPLIFYKRRNSSLKFFDFIFQLLFSGVLQSKLYAVRI